ncbi:MAG TPA: hypothetical protein ENK75_04520 [Saprospiraceae bacterium]|nr:hypothetical protein [Saprospiraceae bacterium]
MLLNAASNNTSNLTWEAGNASIINSSIDFDISKPNVLNLDCCKLDFYFCIKVTVKDVNCNVCEKVVCIEKKPEPCEIKVNNVKESYCTNDAVNISWNGNTPSGLVNVYAIPASGGGAILLAGNQPDTGSFTWNIPSTIKPCDRQWNIVIANVDKPEECFDRSNTFTIKCCETTCDCGDWKTDSIHISEILHDEPNPDTEQFSADLKCSEKVKLLNNHSYQFTAPLYTCNPENCDAEFKWSILNSAGQNTQGSGSSFNYTFNQLGNYEVTFTPICGGKECKPCTIMVSVVKGIFPNPHQTYSTKK